MRWDIVSAIVPFTIIRGIFWIVARSVVLDLCSQKEAELFPNLGSKGAVFQYLDSKTNNFLKVLLTWEIVS